MNIRSITLIIALPLAAVLTMSAVADVSHGAHHSNAPTAKLVEVVRNVTQPFTDVNAVAGAGYKPLFGCVSGPDHGAMGVHYINLSLVGDGQIDAAHPEAIIYEPTKNGMQLVGVEYIVDAATWLSRNPAPPMLEGQAFQLVGSPNRYGLPAFYELHAWLWKHNPSGFFEDWNPRVTCAFG